MSLSSLSSLGSSGTSSASAAIDAATGQTGNAVSNALTNTNTNSLISGVAGSSGGGLSGGSSSSASVNAGIAVIGMPRTVNIPTNIVNQKLMSTTSIASECFIHQNFSNKLQAYMIGYVNSIMSNYAVYK